jgi:hypothetical protein
MIPRLNDHSFARGGVMTTANAAAAHRVTYQLETLWDFDYVPTHDELETLYETAKKNQWNGSATIDWSRPVGAEGAILNTQLAFAGTNFFTRLNAEEQDPTLSTLLDYVLQDEGRHVNFGYFALRRAIPEMEPDKRAYLEDFTFRACDKLYGRDERTGFQSIKHVWTEMGWDGDKIWRDTIAKLTDDEALQQLFVSREPHAQTRAPRLDLGAHYPEVPRNRPGLVYWGGARPLPQAPQPETSLTSSMALC